MKKLLSLFLVLALVFSLCVGALADEPAAENELAGKIVILHTNDVHGGYDQGITYAGLAAYKDELLAGVHHGHPVQRRVSYPAHERRRL